jgi:hypothetical protein
MKNEIVSRVLLFLAWWFATFVVYMVWLFLFYRATGWTAGEAAGALALSCVITQQANESSRRNKP